MHFLRNASASATAYWWTVCDADNYIFIAFRCSGWSLAGLLGGPQTCSCWRWVNWWGCSQFCCLVHLDYWCFLDISGLLFLLSHFKILRYIFNAHIVALCFLVSFHLFFFLEVLCKSKFCHTYFKLLMIPFHWSLHVIF